MQAVATALKAIYSSATEEEAELNLELFAEKWDGLYPSTSRVLARAVGQSDPTVRLSRRHPPGHLHH
jgi:transposase-like protein